MLEGVEIIPLVVCQRFNEWIVLDFDLQDSSRWQEDPVTKLIVTTGVNALGIKVAQEVTLDVSL
jgi:hypothetical protein